MVDKRKSKYEAGDIVVLTHSICGLHENMIVTILNATKNGCEEVEIEANGKHLLAKTKYLAFPKPRRFSKELNVGDNVKLKRHSGRFVEGSRLVVLSNYLGTNNKIVVCDERGITGCVSKELLK